MSYEDPFANAPATPEPAQAPQQDEAQQQTAPTQVATVPTVTATVAPVAVSPAGDLSVTFKGDGTYTAPWIVPKYASVADALIDLGESPQAVAGLSQAQRWMALFERSTKMAAHFASLGGGTPNAKPAGGGGGSGSRAPQAAQQAPGGEKRFCEHGEMVFKSGISKAGNAYKLFSCTAPRDQQCKPQYLNDKK
ncbi:hypothetical protein SEA_BLINN1_55 [Mycobacterium phage Blinn1]|uniref:Uncharacterized protein n=1 Tax=Mycobacterium phage Blinn1 TaxID=2656562 RepID=A0A649VQT3_9CAUD|nr:ribonucleoside reductase class II [Mycobacterium phage Blinn1]QGJ94816.1 hypothetical protein SEA_BLINN1_55 [Mycobacterium phage Blinn1]